MTNRSTLSRFVSVSTLSLAVVLAACSQKTQDRAASAAEQTGAAAASAANDVANAAGNAADKVAEGTANAAENLAEGASKAANAVAAGTEAAAKEVAGKVETLDVKKELLADSRIDATDINVNTDGTAKTITLNGSVPTLSQKTLAERIALKEAPGYKIVNNLRVR